MSDEAPDTVSGATRVFLGTAGFVSFLIGAEILREGGSSWVGTALIAAAYPIYSSLAMWKFAVSRLGRNGAKPSLSYLHQRDSDLGGAIKSMARSSAWAAQHLVGSGSAIGEDYLLQIAGSVVRDKILDGDLDVRGRRPGRLDYEVIPRTYWQSSAFHFVNDPISLWRMIIFPTGGVEIAPDGTIARASDAAAAARTSQLATYDSFLIDAYQFEKLWPPNNVIADRKRRKVLRQARRRDLDKDEIQRLS
jgi:hypothetical protein